MTKNEMINLVNLVFTTSIVMVVMFVVTALGILVDVAYLEPSIMHISGLFAILYFTGASILKLVANWKTDK